MLVWIIKNWRWPDLRRQTPGRSLSWRGISFTEDPVEECDHVVILNRSSVPVRVRCSPDRIWAIMQEPPPGPMHRGLACYARIFTADVNLRKPRYVHSQLALPWHVNRTYDELRRAAVPDKPHPSTVSLPGRRDRAFPCPAGGRLRPPRRVWIDAWRPGRLARLGRWLRRFA